MEKNTKMKLLDRIIKLISWMTIAGLILLVFLRRISPPDLPFWMESVCIPILTAAAVGYLTNWIAIWLLFKPYGKHWGFVQGVIPRNKEKLGEELSAIIPEYLLKPEDMADQLGILVRDYLRNPELMEDMRSKVNLFLKKYSAEIAAFLLPYVEDAVRKAVRENLTSENLSILYEGVVMKWLGDDRNRKMLSGGIVSELKRRAPEFTGILRDNVRTGTRDYVRSEYPALTRWLNADEFAAKLVDSLKWERIQTQLEKRLEEQETREIISEELVAVTGNLQAWLRTPEAVGKLDGFLAENREKAEMLVKDYLAKHIPGIVDEWFQKQELWDALEHRLLPLIQAFLLHRIKQEKHAIIQKFDIPGKIRNSVANMDVKQLHEMILRASEDHLTVIQLLGYFLGAIAGLLLIFAQ